MKQPVYRAATEGDIAFIAQVYAQNMDALHGAYRSEAVWAQLMDAQDSRYYIVVTDRPAGWFRMDTEDGECFLGMLQVAPQYQNRGIGRYVLSVAEAIAKKQGYASLGIHTTEDNIPARSLYLSAGYSVTEIGPCTTADGVDRVGYTFQKQL